MLQLTLIGTGLIGGSFALALKQAGQVASVTGVDTHPAHLANALRLGVIDQALPLSALCTLSTSSEAVASADLVVIAVPVRALGATLSALAPHLAAHTLVMDMGSTKSDAVATAAQALGAQARQFVPAHPIAGAEKSGPDAAHAELFVGRNVILTPTEVTDPRAVARATVLWEAVGAKVLRMAPAQHDQIFAAVSHLPHLLAFTLVAEFAQRQNADELFRFAASGFRDFTRIAASSPSMWRDVALTNRAALLQEIDAYAAALGRLRAQVAASDGEGLAALMECSRDHRERWGRGEYN